jgi:hypothetical protein
VGLGCKAEEFKVKGSELKVVRLWFTVLGFGALGAGYQGLGFRVLSLGFRV